MVLSPEGDRYLSFGEHCSRNVDRGSDPLPPELAVSWRKCELCPCFYYRTANDLQRHVHLAHFASNSGLLDCDKTPFGCSYRLQRPLDEAGIPFGPFKYCGMRFATAAALKKHKEDLGHKKESATPTANVPVLPPAAADPVAAQPAPLPAAPTNFPSLAAIPVPARRGRKRKEVEIEEADDDLHNEVEPRKKAQRRGLSPDEAAAEVLRGERDQLVRFGNIKRAEKNIRAMFGSAVRSDTAINKWKKVLNSKDVSVDRLSKLIDEMLAYIEGDDAEDEEDEEDEEKE